MSNDTNATHDDRSSRPVGEPTTTQLILPEGQSVNVRIVDYTLDGARLSSPAEIALVRGQNVRILLTASSRRFALVQHAGWVGTDYHVGVTWKYAHHRIAARAVAPSHDETLPPNTKQFLANLPAQFYTFWQLLDAGRLNVLADAIDQLEKAAKKPRPDLVERTRELKDAIENASTDEFVASRLDELCMACVRQTVLSEPDSPPSTPAVMVRDPLRAHVGRKSLLGTPTWVLGTVVVLAGHLLTII